MVDTYYVNNYCIKNGYDSAQPLETITKPVKKYVAPKILSSVVCPNYIKS